MSRKPRTQPSTRPFRSVESQMTLAHHVAVEEASAAELRGDWRAAFERHRSVPMFAESHHGATLHLLADLGDDAPRWLVSRFLTVMAHRLELYGHPRRSSDLLRRTVPLLYPGGVPFEAMDCQHPEQIGAMIFGHDWVVRQVDVYDRGGLETLLSMPEAAGATALGEHCHEWAEAPMGGYRIVSADGEVMVVADVVSGQELALLDLGLTTRHEPGTHVIGRVVPTGTAPGLLFESTPLAVDRRIAWEVAVRPDRWLDVISRRVRSGALAPAFSHLGELSLSADLPAHSWGALLGHPIGVKLPRHPRTMVAEALKTALTLATDPAALRSHRHLVAELLLDELVDERLVARFATAPYVDAWRALASSLPGPARPTCEHALWLSEACLPDDELAG